LAAHFQVNVLAAGSLGRPDRALLSCAYFVCAGAAHDELQRNLDRKSGADSCQQAAARPPDQASEWQKTSAIEQNESLESLEVRRFYSELLEGHQRIQYRLTNGSPLSSVTHL
jgi:hypothetical protein